MVFLSKLKFSKSENTKMSSRITEKFDQLTATDLSSFLFKGKL